MDMKSELSNRALKARSGVVGVHMDLLDAYYEDDSIDIHDVADVIADLEATPPPSEATAYRRLKEWAKLYYGIEGDGRSVRASRTALARVGLAHQHLFGSWDDESHLCRCGARLPFGPEGAPD